MPANISNKLVISDTSCLIAFANAGYLEILHNLCRTVIVTPEVASEYKDPLPKWIQIVKAKDSSKIKTLNSFLGIGESSAIVLALESENALIILDDKKARRFAQSIGLNIIGILGLVALAHKQGLIDNIDEALAALKSVGFRLPENAAQLIKSEQL
jgi:predicted nucleic acid-binding protein